MTEQQAVEAAEAALYVIEHNGVRGRALATVDDAADVLRSHAIQRGSRTWTEAFAGATIDVCDGRLRFLAISQSSASAVPPQWILHAYPLQRIRIELQGTRHSSRQAVIAQLETVLARLRAGDDAGSDHDDDFGYRFEVAALAMKSIFSSEPAGTT